MNGRSFQRSLWILVALALAGSLLFTAPAEAQTGRFPDVVENHPFADQIDWAADQGITTGYPDGTFRPDTAVTRQAFVAFLFRVATGADTAYAAVADGAGGGPFVDVAPGDTFATEIAWAADLGITNGYVDGRFRPGAVLTRQAGAAMTTRLLAAAPDLTTSATTFVPGDVGPGDAFHDEILEVLSLALFQLDGGDFNPVAPVSRAEGIGALARLSDLLLPLPYEPRWEPYPCTVPTPSGRTTDCGTLTVPENRGDPAGATVDLAVAIVRSKSSTPAPDPVVYLGGGPGGTVMDSLRGRYRSVLGEERDVVMFDQRGIGLSVPELECAERDEATWANFATADPFAVELDRLLVASAACRDRLLASGVDLSAYNTVQSALDLRDLRRALGYDQWNVYGISYGTALGQELLRADPTGVRSIILDSVYPIDDPGFDRVAGAADRAREVLVTGCETNERCAERFPTLRTDISDVVADFNADPWSSVLPDPVTGQDRPVLLDGNDVAAGLFAAMYRTDVIPLLPWIVELVGERREGILTQIATEGIDGITGLTDGMFLSVECHDRGVGVATADVLDLIAARPDLGSIYLQEAHPICETWGVPAAEPWFNQLPYTEIPVLVLAGSYDPITPPEGGRRTADAVPNSTYAEFPQIGHGALGDSACAAEIVRDFLIDPVTGADTSCLADEPEPGWFTP